MIITENTLIRTNQNKNLPDKKKPPSIRCLNSILLEIGKINIKVEFSDSNRKKSST